MSKMGDKVLAGLRHCNEIRDCGGCPYEVYSEPEESIKCIKEMMTDAAAIIDVYEQFARSMAEGDDLK